MTIEEMARTRSKPTFFSRAELARGLGVTKTTVSRLLHGDPKAGAILGAVWRGKQRRVPKPAESEKVSAFFSERREALTKLGKRPVPHEWERDLSQMVRGGLSKEEQGVLWLALNLQRHWNKAPRTCHWENRARRIVGNADRIAAHNTCGLPSVWIRIRHICAGSKAVKCHRKGQIETTDDACGKYLVTSRRIAWTQEIEYKKLTAVIYRLHCAGDREGNQEAGASERTRPV